MNQISDVNPEAVRAAIDQLQLFNDDTGSQYLLIKRISGRSEVKTKSGLILAEEQGKNMGDKAIVLKIASGQFKISVGDKILYHRWAATEIELEGDKFSILSLKDVIAIYARTATDPSQRDLKSSMENIS